MRPRLGMIVPSWNRPCGVAEYSKSLAAALERLGQSVMPVAANPAGAVGPVLSQGLGLAHFQFEYGLCDAEELCRSAAALARNGVPSLVTVHSFDRRAEHANRRVWEGCPRLIVTSETLRSAMVGAGANPEQIQAIPLGIQLYPLPDRAAARAELGLGKEPALGYFGFTYPHKGLENLGLAVRELRRSHPGLRCFLFASIGLNDGSRQAYEHMCRFYNARGLWDGVSLHLGYPAEKDVVRRLHAMDINILPYEELAGVQTSAAVRTVLAARRPVIVTDTAHFADLRDEVHKIPDPSPESIAAGVRALLERPARQQELVERAARYAADHTWERIARTHLAVYDGVRR